MTMYFETIKTLDMDDDDVMNNTDIVPVLKDIAFIGLDNMPESKFK